MSGKTEGDWFGNFRKFVQSQVSTAKFFFADVQPAINARKKEPKEDLLSHLDVLKKQGGGSRFDKNLRPLFEAYL